MVPIATFIDSLLLLLMTWPILLSGAKTTEENLNHAVHFDEVVPV
jgi:hypothetical protein